MTDIHAYMLAADLPDPEPAPRVPPPADLPEGYERQWPESGLPPPLWEAVSLRPHHNTLFFNDAAEELTGQTGMAEPAEHELDQLYRWRGGHAHAAYGDLMPPQNFRLAGCKVMPPDRFLGPMLFYPEARSVWAQLDGEGRVARYVSALHDDDRSFILDVLPFATDLADLMRIIGWDSEPVGIPVGRWDPSGANGPPLN